ncbi:MAG: TlpA disulfide reductase family protein [Rhodanobacteraceae bacterium]
MKLPLTAILCCQIATGAFGLAPGTRTHASEPATRPALKLTTLDGSRFDLASKRGHWVIVNFWATWCSPCIKEMPDLSTFVSSNQNVDAIGLDFEETGRADVEAFLEKHPVAYPVARVDTAKPPADFGVPRGLPTTVVIAPDGTVAKRFLGPVTVHELEAVIAAWKPPAKG